MPRKSKKSQVLVESNRQTLAPSHYEPTIRSTLNEVRRNFSIDQISSRFPDSTNQPYPPSYGKTTATFRAKSPDVRHFRNRKNNVSSDEICTNFRDLNVEGIPKGKQLRKARLPIFNDRERTNEEKHFDEHYKISEATNKLLVGNGEWIRENLQENKSDGHGNYIRWPGELSQTPTTLQYITYDKEWSEKYAKKRPNKHITDTILKQGLTKMIEDDDNPFSSTKENPAKFLYDLSSLTRIHEGTHGLYKNLVRLAIDSTDLKERVTQTMKDDENLTKILSPMKYRAFMLAHKKTELAFKPKKKLKPLESPSNWLADTWKKDNILRVETSLSELLEDWAS